MEMYDIAIIGGGPAGVTAAIYALRAGRKVVLFEGDKIGGILNDIKKIENYPGFKSISGKALAKKMEAQLATFDPTIVRQFVIKVMKSGDEGAEGCFDIYTYHDEYRAKKVIYCGGSRPMTIKAAAGYGGSGVSYCATCDGYFYRGKTVAVVGTGYVAEEDVSYLLPLCKKVYLIGKIAGLSKDIEQIDSSVTRIIGAERLEAVELKNGRRLDLDGLFIALGGASESDIFDDELKDGEGGLIKGLYRAGDATGEFKQIVWACAEGARAATRANRDK